MRNLAFVLLMAAIPGLGQGADQSRACFKKAMTQAAMTDCARDEAARAEAQLDDLYRKLLSRAANQQDVAKIKAVQDAWVAYQDAYLDAMYPAANKQTEYGSSYPMNFLLLRAKLTRQQVAALGDLLPQYSGASR
jgi:uncharacterized protein YecT (DUF1311 family)